MTSLSFVTKKVILLAVIFFSGSYTVKSQVNPSLTHHVEIFSGINFNTFSKKGGVFLIEYNIKMLANFSMNLSAGYSKSFKPESYIVKTYYVINYNKTNYYYSDEYTVTEKEYDIFPFSVGAKYFLFFKPFLPYLEFNVGYNIINARTNRMGGFSSSYDSYDNLPNEFKTQNMEYLPNHSYYLSVGIGTYYPLSSKINLDLRYSYKLDNKIINTHNFIIGISF